MKRIEYTKFGGPEVLKVVDFDLEAPKANEVQIKTHFAGVNFAEIMTRMGLYPGAPKPPSSIGGEASGVIEKVGADVSDFNVGDKVMGFAPFNSHSSHVNIEKKMLMKLPSQFSLEQGAAFPVIYITAFMMMCDLGNLKKNEYIFIRGAGGGVGTAAIQIAKAIGAKIIGASSSWKHEKMKELGTDFCIDYRNENVKEKVLEFTNGYGVDLIIDPVGAKEWKESYEMLAPMGKLIVYGNQNLVTGGKKSLKAMFNEFISMPKVKPYQMIGSNKAIMGYHLGRLKGAEHKIGYAIEGLYQLANQNLIAPIIAETFSYEEAWKAHQYMQDRKNFGKVLIDFSMI